MADRRIHNEVGIGRLRGFRDTLGKSAGAIGEFLNTDARGRALAVVVAGGGGPFVRAGAYDNAKINSANTSRAIPGSKGKVSARDGRGDRRGGARNANLTNG